MKNPISLKSGTVLAVLCCVLQFCVFASAAEEGPAILKNAKVYIAPMNGFETYIMAAMEKKHVPLQIVADKTKADYEINGNAESRKPGWAKVIFAKQTRSDEQASINLTDLKTGAIVFAYAVNKQNSVHGKQSAAEACAKHLKERIEKN